MRNLVIFLEVQSWERLINGSFIWLVNTNNLSYLVLGTV